MFKKENLELSYNELFKLCQSTSIDITKEKIDQVQKDTISQSSRANFFKRRAGRIGASQSKAAAHSDPALPSQSLIQRICYPELHKVNTKVVRHGCKHEASAISAFEESMKKTHTQTLRLSNVVSLLTKKIPGCTPPQIFYVHVTVVGKVVGK